MSAGKQKSNTGKTEIRGKTEMHGNLYRIQSNRASFPGISANHRLNVSFSGVHELR